MIDLSRTPVYITGVAETALGEVRDASPLSMVARAAHEALAEAGLGLGDVDGIMTNYMGEEGSVQVGEYLGIRDPRWLDSSDLGGAAFTTFVHHAAVAIAAGRCETVLVAFASRQRTLRERRATLGGGPSTLDAQFQQPYGLPVPVGHYALIADRHMAELGTTSVQLAEVAASANAWAQLNPKAWRHGTVITAEDVLASRVVATPLHVLDCCLVTDGGAVAVITGAAQAAGAAKPPVRVLGAGESQQQWHIAQLRDATRGPGVVSGREAFGMAGITPADVDVFEPYDSFTITVLMALEDLGFCGRGEAGAFVAEGHLRPGGRLPSMTNGGGLSYGHPGAYGLLLLVEAVRQVRGEAGDRQVPGAQVAVGHGVGGFLSTASTVVLGRA